MDPITMRHQFRETGFVFPVTKKMNQLEFCPGIVGMGFLTCIGKKKCDLDFSGTGILLFNRRSVMKKTSYHVVPHFEGGWAVRKSGSERVSGKFVSQNDAIKRGQELSRQNKTELYIHRQDGTVRQKNSYGNDPCPPKDKK